MAHSINDKCICDGACAQVCPVNAISYTPGDTKYIIDPDICIDCCACEAVCPVNAIDAD